MTPFFAGAAPPEGSLTVLMVVIAVVLPAASLWCYYVVSRLRGRDPLGRGEHPPAPWDELDLWLVLGAFVGFQTMAYLIMGSFRSGADTRSLDLFPRPSSESLLLTLGVGCLTQLMVIWMVVGITLRHRGGRLSQLGLHTNRLGRNVGLGVLAYVAVVPLVFGLFHLIQFVVGIPPGTHPIEDALRAPSSRGLVFLAALTALVTAPLGEELLFRGFLQSWIRPRLGRWTAIVITGVIFGLMHSSLPQTIPPLVVLGLALGYVYDRTGSLLAPIAMHAVFNGVTTVSVMLQAG